MIAIGSYNKFRMDDSTWTDTSSSYCSPSKYYVTGYYTRIVIRDIPDTILLSLKELMKLWAIDRMRIFWFNPFKIKPRKIIKLKPIPLRGVRLWGYGWANQK